jgi:hypothetical protein
MAIQIQGNGGTVAEVDGTVFRALRTLSKPIDYGSLGHYNWGGFSGILPAALSANSEIWQFRWADSTRIAIIMGIKISACVTTTFFAAGVPVQIDLIKSTAWTVAGTGGTAITPAATLKSRTSMGSALLAAGDMRIATTAALGAGTKTLEANSIRALLAPGPITGSLNGQIIAPGTFIYNPDPESGEHPLVLVQNEGLSIRSVAVPATGTWQVAIDIKWAEVNAY